MESRLEPKWLQTERCMWLKYVDDAMCDGVLMQCVLRYVACAMCADTVYVLMYVEM